MFIGLLITLSVVCVLAVVFSVVALVSALMVDITPLDFGDDGDV